MGWYPEAQGPPSRLPKGYNMNARKPTGDFVQAKVGHKRV